MPPSHLFAAVYFTLVGLIVGSYLNVVVHRLPRGLSTVLPRSRCPSCGTKIRPYDNLPLLSFLFLRGRCRACRAPIPRRYPLVEGLTGALFLLSFLRFGFRFETVGAALFCATLVALATIDYEHFLLPDALTLPGTLVGLCLSPWLGWTSPLDSALGALLGGGILLLVIGGWWLLRKEQAMGYGDPKMLAMIGAFLGVEGVLVTLFFASISGALIGGILLLRGRVSMRSKLQFGVFLAVGAVVGLFAGDALLLSYRQLL